MPYNYNWPQRGNSYSYNRGGYGNNYGSRQGFSFGGYNSNSQRPKKRTGAKFKAKDKNGNPCTTGWHKGKYGFTKFLCVVTKSSVESESKKGNRYISVMVVVQRDMLPPSKTSGLMNTSTGKVTVESMGIVINPGAPNGGFCGKYGNKR